MEKVIRKERSNPAKEINVALKVLVQDLLFFTFLNFKLIITYLKSMSTMIGIQIYLLNYLKRWKNWKVKKILDEKNTWTKLK
jgi:hypothetical protein